MGWSILQRREARIAELEARLALLHEQNAAEIARLKGEHQEEMEALKAHYETMWPQRCVALEHENATLRQENATLRQENEKLGVALAETLNRVAALERRLDLSSQNSSKPPSSDDPNKRKKRRKKKGSGRKPGGQTGHPGHHRELVPMELVDHVHSCLPTHCEACGLEFEDPVPEPEPTRFQVHELVPKLVEVNEYQCHTCECPACGHPTRASLPPEIKSGWGTRLLAVIAMLATIERSTRRQIDSFLKEVLGVPSSLGTVQAHLEGEVSLALEPAWQQAYQAVLTGPWVGLDETGWRIQGHRGWIWAAEGPTAAVLLLREHRSSAEARELVGEPGNRVFITDRYPAYEFLGERRQICRAHLLREFIGMSERDGPVGNIGLDLVILDQKMFHQLDRVRDGTRDRADFVRWVKRKVRPQWEALLHEANTHGDKAPAVVRWLLQPKHLNLAWTFLDHPDVEPTNNTTERALRGPVLQRKVSWGSRSEAGMRLMERLWTTAETRRIQGRSLLAYLTEAIDAWRKGAPAPILV